MGIENRDRAATVNSEAAQKPNSDSEHVGQPLPDVILGRHQESRYQLNETALKKENPREPIDADTQDFDSDLTEKGKIEARRQAEEFFDGNHFEPEKDAFFFASSNFVRAIETATIWRKVAEERGFEIIAPINPRDQTVARVGEGKVRHVDALSLRIEDALLDQLFNAKKDYLTEALERGVEFDSDFVDRWTRARKIVEEDNRNGWSDNWRAHSEEVKKILPEIQMPKELFDTQFKNIIRLLGFANKKIEAAAYGKHIRVVAISHENLFTHWLSEYWNEEGMKLGETISLYYPEGTDELRARFRGRDEEVKV
jgi:phosphohistidine phosphatase SixA